MLRQKMWPGEKRLLNGIEKEIKEVLKELDMLEKNPKELAKMVKKSTTVINGSIFYSAGHPHHTVSWARDERKVLIRVKTDPYASKEAILKAEELIKALDEIEKRALKLASKITEDKKTMLPTMVPVKKEESAKKEKELSRWEILTTYRKFKEEFKSLKQEINIFPATLDLEEIKEEVEDPLSDKKKIEKKIDTLHKLIRKLDAFIEKVESYRDAMKDEFYRDEFDKLHTKAFSMRLALYDKHWALMKILDELQK